MRLAIKIVMHSLDELLYRCERDRFTTSFFSTSISAFDFYVILLYNRDLCNVIVCIRGLDFEFCHSKARM